MLNLYAAHRDPKIFPDPDTLVPERWFDPNLDTSYWLSFGSGPKVWFVLLMRIFSLIC
jgi:C-22 sterol desaturase